MIVESGNLSNVPDRLGLVMSLLAGMGYDAIGEGDYDLRTCGALFFSEAEKNKLTVLDSRPNPPQPSVPYLIKTVDGVKVGIVSFGGAGPDQTATEYERRKVMYGAYRAAREASDILIVLDQANVIGSTWLGSNGKRLGVPDIVISGIQKMNLGSPETIGRTHIVPTSMQGKNIGQIDIEIVPGGEPKLTWNRVVLDESMAEDEKAKGVISAFVTNPAGTQAHPAVMTPVATQPGSTPADKIYYSPELCRTCHVKEYDDWAKSGHARAIKTLVTAQRMVPECLPCHSEEYRQLGSVTIPEDDIGGVECATCHMAALPHDVERKNAVKKTRVDRAMCLTCHTKERSPKYDEYLYFPKVSHPGAASGLAQSR